MADNSSTSNSSVKRFALRALLAVLLVALIDQGLGLVLGTLYDRTREGDFGGCINLTLEQRNDVVVFGSSRAKHHYIPDVLEKSTGRSFFNAGIDAQNLLCHYGIAQLVLSEYTPKAFILDLNPEDLREAGGTASLDKLSVLLPYYKRGNPALNALLLERSKFERVRLLSAAYPYNSMLMPLLKYTLKPDSAGTIKSRGFLPYFGSDVLEIVRIEEENAPAAAATTAPAIDPFQVQTLRKFAESAREKGVKFIVCLGPLWEKKGQDLADHTALLEAYLALLEELEVPVVRVDSGTNDIFLKPELYKDRIHINKEGASAFSEILGEQLRPHLAD
ncbi:MAG: hypothetical protein JNK74_16260 [Candidatus Hydrogenedentes bacterium]|nr:hypothetical protein [Candidatus Hydrogenedentota bacterium]